jgi:hypothetical protein
MDSPADTLAGLRLEGLLLRDGEGAYYEVPCVIIERYRIASVFTTQPQQRPAVDGAGNRDLAPDSAWIVAGGVYAPPADEARAGPTPDNRR